MARRVFILFFWVATCCQASVAAGEAGWPWRGEVGGKVVIAALDGLGLDWRVQARADGLELSARRAGVEVVLEARPAAGGEWAWTVVRGEVDLAEMWPALRALAGEEAAAWSASGRVRVAGEGRWSLADGPRGEVRVSLREGWARSEERGLELDGVELDLVTQDLSGAAWPAGQNLRVARLTKAQADVRDLRVVFGLTKERMIKVAEGEAGFLGGKVKLAPFAVALDAPVVRAVAQVEALQLAETARLLPWLFAEGQGSLRGRAALDWDETKGLRVRDGGLDIVPEDRAVLRLAPSPGLLTGDMPEFFGLLPASWRWARWVGFRNPAHGPLRDIELGREGLRIESFQVTFWPDGPTAGRTLAIRIVGRPTSEEWVEEVVMDLNVHGPLAEVMGFGLNQDFGAVRLQFK